MIETAAASGTLVASSMEAAGYFYQAYLLDSLMKPFTSAIGALFYVIAVLTALINFAVLGQYKLSRWLIFGPVVFFAVITARTEAITPRWKFAGVSQEEITEGATEAYRAAVKRTVGQRANADAEAANVSSLFSGYNNLISSVVQQLTKVITHVRQDERLNGKFLIRPMLHGVMTNAVSNDPLFNQLLHDGFIYQCAGAVEAAIEVNNVLGAPEHRTEKAARMRAALNGTTVTIGDNSLLYLAGLRADYGDLWRGVPAGQSINAAMERVGTPPTDDQLSRERKVMQARHDILKDHPGATFTCGQIWDMVYLGLHIEAEKLRLEQAKGAAQSGMSGGELAAELLKVEGLRSEVRDDDLFSQALAIERLRQIVARNLLKNHFSSANSVYPAFLSRMAVVGEGVDSVTTQGLRNSRENYRHVRKADEWRQKSEAFSHAENMPYYQGVSLFFLAICFPFFALLLLIPGRYTAFMHWFFLWMWVKSWDVGFAVVMCLDDLLFDLLVAVREKAATNLDSIYPDGATGELFGQTLDQALLALEAVDPSFGPTIYYTIIGAALAAIPSVTSQLVLGAASAGSQLIAAGMELQASKRGDAAGMVDTQIAGHNTRANFGDEVMDTARQNLESFRQGQGSPADLGAVFKDMTDPTKEAINSVWGQAIDAVLGKTIDEQQQRGMYGNFVQKGLQSFAASSAPTAKQLLSKGVHGDPKQFERLAFLAGLQSEAQNGSAFAQELAAAISKQALEFRSLQVKAAGGWSRLQAANSPMSLEAASLSAMYGNLQLPWQVDDTAFSEEFALDMQSTYLEFAVANLTVNQVNRFSGKAPGP